MAASAIISNVPISPGGGFTFKPCFDLTSCAITVAISVFFQLFKSKIACLFGSETGIGDIIKGGIKGSSFTAAQKVGVDNFLNIVNKSENFGGQIIQVMECKCKGGDIANDFLDKHDVFVVGNPLPAVVAPTISSKIYNYNSLKEGNWVLGQKTNTKVCRNPIAYGIKQVGTSR